MITKFVKFIELNFPVITRSRKIKVCLFQGPIGFVLKLDRKMACLSIHKLVRSTPDGRFDTFQTRFELDLLQLFVEEYAVERRFISSSIRTFVGTKFGCNTLNGRIISKRCSLVGLKNLDQIGFLPKLNSLAMMTGNLLSSSKNAYSRWGGVGGSLFKNDYRCECPRRDHNKSDSTSGEVVSSSRARKAFASSNSRKSLSPNGVKVGDELATIGSKHGEGFPDEILPHGIRLKIDAAPRSAQGFACVHAENSHGIRRSAGVSKFFRKLLRMTAEQVSFNFAVSSIFFVSDWEKISLRIWITEMNLNKQEWKLSGASVIRGGSCPSLPRVTRKCSRNRKSEAELVVQILKACQSIANLGLQVLHLGFACFLTLHHGCGIFSKYVIEHRVSEEQALDEIPLFPRFEICFDICMRILNGRKHEVEFDLQTSEVDKPELAWLNLAAAAWGHILLDIVCSATSDEIAGVEELVLILATTTLFLD
ncbi:hypothetical protein Tco_0383415 [Tanacetum coccineum]